MNTLWGGAISKNSAGGRFWISGGARKFLVRNGGGGGSTITQEKADMGLGGRPSRQRLGIRSQCRIRRSYPPESWGAVFRVDALTRRQKTAKCNPETR